MLQKGVEFIGIISWQLLEERLYQDSVNMCAILILQNKNLTHTESVEKDNLFSFIYILKSTIYCK